MITLRGNGFSLRQAGEEDYELVTKWNFDPIVSRYFSPRPEYNEDAQKSWFKKMLEDRSKLKFMILPDHSVTPIGLIGLQNISIPQSRAEVGISTGEKEWLGKGIGRKSLLTLMHHAFEELSLHQLRAEVFKENKKALSLFMDCGFKETGVLRHQWKLKDVYHDVILLSIIKTEFSDYA